MITMAKNVRMILLLFCGLTLHCTSSLTGTFETTYYRMEYPYEETACTETVRKALRIKSFSENLPYDRNEMVVVGPQRNVNLSFKHLWIGRPGEMIAQKLAEDFTRDPMFDRVVSLENPVAAPLELNGRIFQFAWAVTDSKARAVLDVVVRISDRDEGKKVLFTRQYQFESPYRPAGKPELFAEAMSELMRQFSAALRRDVCAALKS